MSTTKQPSFHCVANLGDANPFEDGGRFLMVDRRGIYDPELLVFSEWTEESPTMTLHTIELEPCFPIDRDNGCHDIGDNIHHTYMAAWFGKHEDLESLASFIGIEPLKLRQLFCGNPYDRAQAYGAVADYWGLANFDQYPRTFTTKREARAFCNRMLSQIKRADSLPDGW